MFLIFDTDHFNATGVYTLTDKRGASFTFADAMKACEFCEGYYRNPVAALFAYNLRLIHHKVS